MPKTNSSRKQFIPRKEVQLYADELVHKFEIFCDNIISDYGKKPRTKGIIRKNDGIKLNKEKSSLKKGRTTNDLA
jgi:hypothetical protein